MLLTVVVADPQRMTAMRDGLPTPGRVLRYPTSNLVSVFESIRANQPGLIIIDSVFLRTPAGHAFVERINQLSLPKVVLQAAVFDRGQWKMTSIGQPGPSAAVVALSPRIAAVTAGLDTRRAPRFLVQNIADALAEGTSVKVVNLSVLGAQIISQPLMRPNQKVKVGLPDAMGAIQLTASVAWSVFEKPAASPAPHFRVGMEFSDATKEALEDYCTRHCIPDPLPIRR
jgi:hypothetical protein